MWLGRKLPFQVFDDGAAQGDYVSLMLRRLMMLLLENFNTHR